MIARDKVKHLVAFFGAGVAAQLLLKDKEQALGITLAMGAVTETVQPMVGRHADVLDFVANVVGGSLGVWMAP